jgi:probable rRNA maturation factor
VVLADLVLCATVVEAEARAQGIALDAHYAHLLVHGALHAQGMDHELEAEALAMEARESEILVALGWPDPYRRDQVAPRTAAAK